MKQENKSDFLKLIELMKTTKLIKEVVIPIDSTTEDPEAKKLLEKLSSLKEFNIIKKYNDGNFYEGEEKEEKLKLIFTGECNGDLVKTEGRDFVLVQSKDNNFLSNYNGSSYTDFQDYAGPDQRLTYKLFKAFYQDGKEEFFVSLLSKKGEVYISFESCCLRYIGVLPEKIGSNARFYFENSF